MSIRLPSFTEMPPFVSYCRWRGVYTIVHFGEELFASVDKDKAFERLEELRAKHAAAFRPTPDAGSHAG